MHPVKAPRLSDWVEWLAGFPQQRTNSSLRPRESCGQVPEADRHRSAGSYSCDASSQTSGRRVRLSRWSQTRGPEGQHRASRQRNESDRPRSSRKSLARKPAKKLRRTKKHDCRMGAEWSRPNDVFALKKAYSALNAPDPRWAKINSPSGRFWPLSSAHFCNARNGRSPTGTWRFRQSSFVAAIQSLGGMGRGVSIRAR